MYNITQLITPAGGGSDSTKGDGTWEGSLPVNAFKALGDEGVVKMSNFFSLCLQTVKMPDE